MEVFRISKKAFSEINGMGGLLYPGRWHFAGNRIIYTSESRSLAILESLVHLSQTHLLNNDFVLTKILIPDDASVQKIDNKKLVKDWYKLPNVSQSQKIGTDFIKRSKYLLLKVPSAIVTDEFNFLINPNHSDFKDCTIVQQIPFNFDARLK